METQTYTEQRVRDRDKLYDEDIKGTVGGRNRQEGFSVQIRDEKQIKKKKKKEKMKKKQEKEEEKKKTKRNHQGTTV